MRISIIFKDGETATFNDAYQIDTTNNNKVVVNFYYDDDDDVVSISADYDKDKIAAIVTGEYNIIEFKEE